MRIHVVTIFPEFFASPLAVGIPKRARETGLLQVSLVDLREYTHDRHRSTDDTPVRRRPRDGDEGRADRRGARSDRDDAHPSAHRVLLSPRGHALDHRKVMALAAVEDPVLRVWPLRGRRRACARLRGRGAVDRRLRALRRRARRAGRDRRGRAADPRGPRQPRVRRLGVVRRRSAGVSAVHPPGDLPRSRRAAGPALRRSRRDRRVAHGGRA